VAVLTFPAIQDSGEDRMNGRLMGVDPGDKRIGIALSDPTGTIASPFQVLEHISRIIDAAQIGRMAAEQGVIRIVVGQALDDEGEVGPSGRKAQRLAEAIQSQSTVPVELWDESFSTEDARTARLLSGASRRQRKGHMDDLAAAVLLQNYLDVHRYEEEL
jgi:putative Holliday junction resolvase